MHELLPQRGTPIEVQALKEYRLFGHLSTGEPRRFSIHFKTTDLGRWAEIVSKDPSSQQLGVVMFQRESKSMRFVPQQKPSHRKEEFSVGQFRIMVNGKMLKPESARPQFMFSLDLSGALDPTLDLTTIEVVGPQSFRNGMLAIMYMRNEWADNPPLPDRILQTEKTRKELNVLVQKHRAREQRRHMQALRKAQKQIPSDRKPAASPNRDRSKHDELATAPSQQAASASQPAASLNDDRSKLAGPANASSQQAASATQPPTPTHTPTPANEPVPNDDEDDDLEVEAIEKEIVSFKCPISLLRIYRPVRGRACRHRQCFDAVTFRTINGNGKNPKAKWTCPVCDQPCGTDPPTDKFFANLLRTYPDASRCVILAGGRHEALEDSFGGDVVSDDDDE
ncbi:SUMO ligase siz1 [Borealophlyctis nickersoniae]|nr:SUMO ligase siz1 [Borealophlyctis nickersoniae]